MSEDRQPLLDDARRYSFAIAYRMLGTVSDAEDIAQDAVIRLSQTLDGAERVLSWRAYVATVTTRLAIDYLRSARVRREEYFGEWLPEPLIDYSDADLEGRVEVQESISQAFLIVMETLSPEQRAVFLLRDVFGYGYAEIARIVGKSEANVRQIAARARRSVAARRPRFHVSDRDHERLVAAFFNALERADLPALEAILSEDVVLHGDGGGKAPAIRQPIVGTARVARALMGWAVAGLRSGARVLPVDVNGVRGGLVVDAEERAVTALAIATAGDKINAIYSIVNPDKLSHLGRVGDIRRVLRSSAKDSAG